MTTIRIVTVDSRMFAAGMRVVIHGDAFRVLAVDDAACTLTVKPTWWTRVKRWLRRVLR